MEESKEYYKVEVTIEFTKECLASNLVEHTFEFERDDLGNMLLPTMYWRCMLKKALEIFIPDKVYLLNKICPDTLRHSPSRIDVITEANQVYQALPVGAQLTIHIIVPAAIPPDTFRHLFEQAGQWVGFSPAKAHLGYGRFRVVGYEELTLKL